MVGHNGVVCFLLKKYYGKNFRMKKVKKYFTILFDQREVKRLVRVCEREQHGQYTSFRTENE